MVSITEKNCVDCGGVIPPERLEAIPETIQCIKCASRKPRIAKIDPNEVCARSSNSARNGWGASD